MKLSRGFATAGLLACAVSRGWSTPSGLNNIPTAEVAPEDVIVFQQINNLGRDQVWFHSLGFKYGIAKDWEVGVDGLVTQFNEDATGTGTGGGGVPSYPFTFQAKRRFETGAPGLSLGLGVANLSANSDKAGDPAVYGVATSTQKRCRMHVGFLTSGGNAFWFAGVDAPVQPRTTARLDWIQANEGEASVFSLGAIHILGPEFAVEAWVSNTTAGGVHNTMTIKFGFPLSLHH